MVKFYGYKKCDTCHKAELFLQHAGVDYDFIDITKHPPSATELSVIVTLAKAPLTKLFNTSGLQYRELKIKDQLATLSDQAILTLLASNGRLIKRPLINDEKRATIGFNEEQFAQIWR